MASDKGPSIGLIVDNDLSRHLLQGLLVDGGYQVIASLNSQQELSPESVYQPDAWVIDVSGGVADALLEQLTEHTETPLLMIDDIPSQADSSAYLSWCRRLLEKLEVVAVRAEDSRSASTKKTADCVWVLAASLGGPEAVKCFLNALPKGLPLAIVYAQHTEIDFDRQLSQMMSGQQNYLVHLARGESFLLEGEITIVPVDQQLRFLDHGRVVKTNKPWQGAYQPAIDQVVAELARVYRDKLGLIVFSGTCDDAKVGCHVVKACGGTVWAQSPESCVSTAMPDAAIDTGCVSYQGSPEQLAEALVLHMAGESIAP